MLFKYFPNGSVFSANEIDSLAVLKVHISSLQVIDRGMSSDG